MPNLQEAERRLPSEITGRLVVDDSGNLWVYNRGLADRPDYLIYGTTGTLIARATLPKSLRKGKYPKPLVDAGGNRALVLDFIELNTPVIKVYTLTRH